MAPLTIYKDNYADSTVVSNRFIDDYMTEANDAQLKVYFYLIRMLNADQAVSVSGIADKFNHTEKDVIRALKYWEKRQILDLDYDCNKNLTGVHLRNLSAEPVQPAITVPTTPSPGPAQSVIASPIEPSAAPVPAAPAVQQELQPELQAEFPTIVKPSYSLDQLKEFKDREDTAQLLFVAESYIGKPLTPSEIKTILFFTDVLHFSEDLIDYLIQYCVERGKKDFKYIEKVAINWAEEGVTTPKQAQQYATRYDKNVYAIMNELGKKNSPTSKEIEYINRWTKEYGFTTDIILEACERTVLATDRHRFEYAEGILSSWKRENVHHKADIHRIDKLYQKKKTSAPTTGSNVSNKFNQFTQNSYDFEALERELLSN